MRKGGRIDAFPSRRGHVLCVVASRIRRRCCCSRDRGCCMQQQEGRDWNDASSAPINCKLVSILVSPSLCTRASTALAAIVWTSRAHHSKQRQGGANPAPTDQQLAALSCKQSVHDGGFAAAPRRSLSKSVPTRRRALPSRDLMVAATFGPRRRRRSDDGISGICAALRSTETLESRLRHSESQSRSIFKSLSRESQSRVSVESLSRGSQSRVSVERVSEPRPLFSFQ